VNDTGIGYYLYKRSLRFDINRSFWYNTNKFTERLSTVYSLVPFFIVFINKCNSRWEICAWFCKWKFTKCMDMVSILCNRAI